MNQQQIVDLKNDWYSKLILDLKQLVFDGIVQTKHMIGKRILEDELKFEKPEYGSKKIELLANDLNVETRDLYRCIQFARKYPEIPESVTCDKISWRTIVNEYLPEKKHVNANVPSWSELDVLSDELSGLMIYFYEDFECIIDEAGRRLIDSSDLSNLYANEQIAISYYFLYHFYRQKVIKQYDNVLNDIDKLDALLPVKGFVQVPVDLICSMKSHLFSCIQQLEVSIERVTEEISENEVSP